MFRFVQHTARHERLDTLCGDEFQGFRGVPCGREECELNTLHNSSRLQAGPRLYNLIPLLIHSYTHTHTHTHTVMYSYTIHSYTLIQSYTHKSCEVNFLFMNLCIIRHNPTDRDDKEPRRARPVRPGEGEEDENRGSWRAGPTPAVRELPRPGMPAAKPRFPQLSL